MTFIHVGTQFFLVSISLQICGFGHLTKRFSLTNEYCKFYYVLVKQKQGMQSVRVSCKKLSYSFWISRPQLSKDKLK